MRHIVLLVSIGLAGCIGDSPDFRIAVLNGAVTIQSMNQGMLTVEDVVINRNPNCNGNKAAQEIFGDDNPILNFKYKGRRLSYGDVLKIGTGCTVLEVQVMTDRGTSSYGFAD